MTFDLQTDVLGDFDGYDFSTLDSSSPPKQFCHMGACLQTMSACVAISISLSAWVWSPPAWLQPTIVGMLWASLFLIGAAAGSVRRGHALFACMAGGYVWLSQLAMQSLTSLVAVECGLVAVCTFSAGWLLTQFEFSGRSPQNSMTRVKRYQQWTIWDLALLTTLVAVICYALPRLESPLILLTQVGFVLLGSYVGSWMAYRWVFDDCWSTNKLIGMLVGCGLCFWIMFFSLTGITGLQTLSQQAPELSLQRVATWMLTGPLAVIAAEGLTVLAMLTAIRLDQGSLIKARTADAVVPVEPEAPPDILSLRR